ncbi:MAG: delta-aminolevulinic acid dehydratase [Flavobacteriaceae bacterium]|nr:delta-aminolevulinic acid dehydratase [Flavobacteriaceae bacterium]
MKKIEKQLNQQFKHSFKKLKNYCEKENFKGWDPYDGLNSWVIQKTFLGKSRFFRLAWIQSFKRNPINFRPLFGIKKDYNPKGLGLFLIGYCNLYKVKPNQEYLNQINVLSSELLKLQTKGYSGACWGYNFDWQARAFYQPKYTPTVVATTFIGEALLEAYEITKRQELLDTAISCSQFVLTDLNKSYDTNNNFTLSYSPLDKTQVYNAGLLGAKLLSLIFKYTKEPSLLNEARKIVAYVCDKQQKSGAWSYGTLPFHQWVDNFHTGYNLECIYTYQSISGDKTFKPYINKGLNYYLDTFFTKEGISKYYNNSIFPIDIHAPSQLVVTLSKLELLAKNKELVDRVLNWTIDNMQSPKGYFYYQKKKYITSKISYIRWAQSWMFYAFSYYHLEFNKDE